MAASAVGAALSAASLVQLVTVQIIGHRAKNLGGTYFRKEVDSDKSGDLGLPSDPGHRDYVIEVLLAMVGACTAAVSVAAALSASLIGCLTTLVAAILKKNVIVAILLLANLVLGFSFTGILFAHIARGELDLHVRDREIKVQQKSKRDTPGAIKRRGHNFIYHIVAYFTNVWHLYLLTAYKTVLIGSSAGTIVAAIFIR